MAKRTVMLLALMGLCGPAYGQVPHVDGLTGEGVPGRVPTLEEVASVAPGDCEERYRTLRARSHMRPSDRKAALEVCSAAANAEEWQGKLAKQPE